MSLFSFYNNYFDTIKSKLIVSVTLIHAVLMGLIVYDLTSRQQVFIEEQVSQKGYEISSILASSASTPLINNDLVALGEILLDTYIIKDHHMVFILNKRGQVKASTDKQYFNKYLDDNISKELFSGLLDNNTEEYQIDHHNFIDTLHKVSVQNNTVGYVRTIIDKSSLTYEIDVITKRGLLYIVLAILLGGIFAWFSVRKTTDKLNSIVIAAEKISNKNFDFNLKVSEGEHDEVSKMVNAFKTMSNSINEYINEIELSKTELESSKVKLLEAQERFQLAIDGSDSGLFDWNIIANSMFHSIRYETMLGYAGTELPNTVKAWSDLVHPNDIESAWGVVNKYIKSKGKTKYRNIFRMKRKDGSWSWIEGTGKAIFDSEGHAVRFIGFNTDITQRVNNERKFIEQSKLAQMGEMISMIAHQWRQPLSAIAATTINLKVKSQLNSFDLSKVDEAKEYESYVNKQLDSIDSFVENLTTTIDDFRNFYKSNKNTSLSLLQDIVLKSLKITRTSIENDNIKIIEEYNSLEPIYVYESELMQVVLNIVKNSQDNFREKNIENPYIKITTQIDSITITDNGGGIPEDIITKIFDPYFSTKTDKNGTGLGLYMSNTIVKEHHNGELSAFNTDDGVSFVIKCGVLTEDGK